MKWHFSKFGNCSGISQKHQIWSGIYQINPKQKYLGELLGSWCQPLVVQFSRLLTTLTMAWDRDVRNPLGGAIFLLA